MRRLREHPSAAKKKANPASLRSAAPSKGRGSCGHSLLPMEGGAPKGRRLDGGSGIPDTKPSPMGKAAKREYRFSRTVKANTCICGKTIPTDKAFPAWGRKRGGGFAAKKGSQPRLVALGSPFQGKGLARSFPPSYGRRCPEAAEVGWGCRYPRNKAFPAWGRWRAERAG